jgi:trans-aconitate 2-methyltransferase
MSDWNPSNYLKFKNERTQPAIDLVQRIPINNPQFIIDLGCGPGNSTRILAERWPKANIVAIDSSPEMINKARSENDTISWKTADIDQYSDTCRYDIVFSNAALQWIMNHGELIPRLFKMTNTHGILAAQVPLNCDSPLHQAVICVSHSKRWSDFASKCNNLLNYQSASYYYDILSKLSAEFYIWETTYMHVMENHNSLIEWYRTTGMRPYLDALPDDTSRAQFEHDVLTICQNDYSLQKDGKLLFPFRRLFFMIRNI